MSSEKPEELLPGFDRQEQERFLFVLKNTTPLQRIEWLEETLLLLEPYLRRRDVENPNPPSA